MFLYFLRVTPEDFFAYQNRHKCSSSTTPLSTVCLLPNMLLLGFRSSPGSARLSFCPNEKGDSMQIHKNERYFYLADDPRVAVAIIQSVPTEWGIEGWIDGYLSTGRGKPVTFVEAGSELAHFGVSFDDTRTRIIELLERGHKGWIDMCNGCYGKARHKRLATCRIQIGPSDIE